MNSKELKEKLEVFIEEFVFMPQAGVEDEYGYFHIDNDLLTPLEARRNFFSFRNNPDNDNRDTYAYFEDSVICYGCMGRDHTSWIDFNEIGINPDATVEELMKSIEDYRIEHICKSLKYEYEKEKIKKDSRQILKCDGKFNNMKIKELKELD